MCNSPHHSPTPLRLCSQAVTLQQPPSSFMSFACSVSPNVSQRSSTLLEALRCRWWMCQNHCKGTMTQKRWSRDEEVAIIIVLRLGSFQTSLKYNMNDRGQGKNSRTSKAAGSQVLSLRQPFTSGCEPKTALPASPGRTGDLPQGSAAHTAAEHAGCLIIQGPGFKWRCKAERARNKTKRAALKHSTVSCGHYKYVCWCSVTFSFPAVGQKLTCLFVLHQICFYLRSFPNRFKLMLCLCRKLKLLPYK